MNTLLLIVLLIPVVVRKIRGQIRITIIILTDFLVPLLHCGSSLSTRFHREKPLADFLPRPLASNFTYEYMHHIIRSTHAGYCIVYPAYCILVGTNVASLRRIFVTITTELVTPY